MAETSTKPYLIRAIHEWCIANGYTPYVAVVVDERTVVPREYVRRGEIVLNVSPVATHRLHLGNEFIEFQARFAGVARDLQIPVENVSAIYASENGHGMAFDVTPASGGEPAVSGEAAGIGEGDGNEIASDEPAGPRSAGPRSVDGGPGEGSPADGSPAEREPAKGRRSGGRSGGRAPKLVPVPTGSGASAPPDEAQPLGGRGAAEESTEPAGVPAAGAEETGGESASATTGAGTDVATERLQPTQPPSTDGDTPPEDDPPPSRPRQSRPKLTRIK